MYAIIEVFAVCSIHRSPPLEAVTRDIDFERSTGRLAQMNPFLFVHR